MAATPEWKIYDAGGNYQAACKEPEAAACLVSFYGNGSTVRHGHKAVVWTQGPPDGDAGMSYDEAAHTMRERVNRDIDARFPHNSGAWHA